MDFTTIEYYSHFLPATLIAVFILGYRKRNTQISLLLVSSYAFFWFASGWHVILLLISTLLDWYVSNKINSTNEISSKKRWLTLSLVINLGLLGIFKYLDYIKFFKNDNKHNLIKRYIFTEYDLFVNTFV